MNFVNIRERKQFSFYVVDLIGLDAVKFDKPFADLHCRVKATLSNK